MKCTRCGGDLEKERWQHRKVAICQKCQKLKQKNDYRNKRNNVSNDSDSSHVRYEK